MEYYKKNTRKNIVIAIIRIDPEYIFNFTKSDFFMDYFPDIMDYIDCELINEINQTFIFKLKNLNEIITVLKSNLKININHLDKYNRTFVTNFAANHTLDIDDFSKIIQILHKKKYNFNNVTNDNRSIFTFAFNRNLNKEANIAYGILQKLVVIPELDITIDLSWIRLLIEMTKNMYKSKIWIQMIIYHVLARNDCVSFMNNVIKKYDNSNSENDLFLLSSTRVRNRGCELLSRVYWFL